MAPQPKFTVVDKVPNIPSVLLGLTQWIHTREATVLRHAITARAKVICTSRISSIYNTHGGTGLDWGLDWGSRTGGRTRGDRAGGRIRGGRTRGWTRGGRTGGRIGSRTGGRTGRVGLGVGLEVGLGLDEVASKIFQVSLRFVDMSSDVDVVYPTYPSLGKVKFGLGKVTSRTVTVTAEAVTTS